MFIGKIMKCQKWINGEMTMVKYHDSKISRVYSVHQKNHQITCPFILISPGILVQRQGTTRWADDTMRRRYGRC